MTDEKTNVKGWVAEMPNFKIDEHQSSELTKPTTRLGAHALKAKCGSRYHFASLVQRSAEGVMWRAGPKACLS